MGFTVAIVGRPNVGKSTLFNRLVGKRLALVDDTPGVTRDRRQGEGRIADLAFAVIDTAGLEEAEEGSLEGRMRAQTERAVLEADVVLLLIDSRAGLTPLDRYFADRLRRGPTPVILVANKCEGGAGEAGRLEAYSLGLGDPLAVSAEHGEGLADLYQALVTFEGKAGETGPGSDEAEARPLRLAVVGRPNVGKSTLINRLVGDERLLTGPEAGITRDAIAISWNWRGHAISLVDTAGLRRKAKVTEKLEELAAGDTLRTIRFADVVVLLTETSAVLEKQDLTIARHVVDEGRALVIGVNKWDLSEDRKAGLRLVAERLEDSLAQVEGVPVVALSALTGEGVEKLLPAVLAIHETWNRRVPTGPLNRWLEAMNERHPPPLANGRANRLRYVTQIKTRPPTFALFAARPGDLPDSYLRYLAHGLRQEFGFDGVPIRISLRKGQNPFAER